MVLALPRVDVHWDTTDLTVVELPQPNLKTRRSSYSNNEGMTLLQNARTQIPSLEEPSNSEGFAHEEDAEQFELHLPSQSIEDK